MPSKIVSFKEAILCKIAFSLKWSTGYITLGKIFSMFPSQKKKFILNEVFFLDKFLVSQSEETVSESDLKCVYKLTEEGLSWACCISGKKFAFDKSSPLPPVSLFIPYFLKVAGRSAKFFAGKDFQVNSLFAEVLSEIGFLDNTLPFCPKKDLLPLFYYAIRDQHTQEYPTITYKGKGVACLTFKGLVSALKLNGLIENHQPNTTAQYFESLPKNFTNHIAGKISTKYRLSQDMDLSHDHVNKFVLRKISTDAFRERFDRDKPVNLSLLVSWCKKSACTDIRDWGVDASTRALRGAKTKYGQEEFHLDCGESKKVVWVENEEEGGKEISDYSDGGAHQEKIELENLLQQMHSVIRERMPEKAEKMIKVLSMELQKAPRCEIDKEVANSLKYKKLIQQLFPRDLIARGLK